jgi:hypothetical protein
MLREFFRVSASLGRGRTCLRVENAVRAGELPFRSRVATDFLPDLANWAPASSGALFCNIHAGNRECRSSRRLNRRLRARRKGVSRPPDSGKTASLEGGRRERRLSHRRAQPPASRSSGCGSVVWDESATSDIVPTFMDRSPALPQSVVAKNSLDNLYYLTPVRRRSRLDTDD